MNINEKGLITLVKRYPLLYDMTSPLYLDQQKKDEAWNEIATVTGMSSYTCKSRWTRLRENYRKALILRKKNGKDSSERLVKYEKEMAFLNANFSSTIMKKDRVELKPIPTDELQLKLLVEEKSQTEKTKRQAEPKKHEINAFFDGIAETMKTFPKKIQINLKREIFNLVNNAEASLFNNENEGYLDPVSSSHCRHESAETSTQQDIPEGIEVKMKTQLMEFDESVVKDEIVD